MSNMSYTASRVPVLISNANIVKSQLFVAACVINNHNTEMKLAEIIFREIGYCELSLFVKEHQDKP